MKERLRIAIQKGGRLSEDSLKLLKECGLSVDNADDVLKASVANFPADLLFLRNADIPKYVEDGVADVAIVGENLMVEDPRKLKLLLKLGFSKCKVSLAVPKHVEYPGLHWFNSKKIATSYSHTLSEFLKSNGLQADIHDISGSVEIAPNIGLADAIFDIVSTGSTLFKNGLKEVEVVLHSEAVLLSREALDADRQETLNELIFRIQAVLEARQQRYVLLNAPNDKIEEITNILPGVKSPTVMPLAMEGWSSLHSVIPAKNMWEVIGKLKAAGAQGILVIPIEKMVM
jgi:ATP phosphoribosyltransferase